MKKEEKKAKEDAKKVEENKVDSKDPPKTKSEEQNLYNSLSFY